MDIALQYNREEVLSKKTGTPATSGLILVLLLQISKWTKGLATLPLSSFYQLCADILQTEHSAEAHVRLFGLYSTTRTHEPNETAATASTDKMKRNIMAALC